jgi:hypothetical protein
LQNKFTIKDYTMEKDGQEVKTVSISFRVNGNKSHLVCAPERADSIMRRMALDGATDIKIMHYYNESGTMIKKKK